MTNSNQQNIERVAQRMVEQLEELIKRAEAGENVSWLKPWNASSGPMSYATGKPYHGINIFLLGIAQLLDGFDSNYWITYDAARYAGMNDTVRKLQKLGVKLPEKPTGKGAHAWGSYFRVVRGLAKEHDIEVESSHVKKGAHGYPVIWPERRMKRKYRNMTPAEILALPESERNRVYYIAICGTTVFNLAQTEGIDYPEVEENLLDFEPIVEGQRVLDESGADIRHGGGVAAYYPQLDFITMPRPETFMAIPAYYNTAFHELVHWTGHKKRLARFEERPEEGIFSTYGFEELVAEMGAVMLRSVLNIADDGDPENSLAYLKGWLEIIKGDPRLVYDAANHAGKAVKLLAPWVFDEEEVIEEEEDQEEVIAA